MVAAFPRQKFGNFKTALKFAGFFLCALPVAPAGGGPRQRAGPGFPRTVWASGSAATFVLLPAPAHLRRRSNAARIRLAAYAHIYWTPPGSPWKDAPRFLQLLL